MPANPQIQPQSISAMKTNELITSRRTELGLQRKEVAERAGIGADAYRDIECYEDEAFTAVELRHLKAICRVLGLRLEDLIQISGELFERIDVGTEATPRNVLVSRARVALGLSQDELGDLIGFETIAIRGMEADQDYLEGWPIDLLRELSTVLRLPFESLLWPSSE